MEKELINNSDGGGFELNSPLIVEPLVPSTKKRKNGSKKSRKSNNVSQKGHGNQKEEQSATDSEIEEALQHPIKVFSWYLYF